jgi:hypothetical protein
MNLSSLDTNVHIDETLRWKPPRQQQRHPSWSKKVRFDVVARYATARWWNFAANCDVAGVNS